MPVHLNIYVVIQSASHVTAVLCIKSCTYRSIFKHENGEKCDLSDFDPGMVLAPEKLD